MEKKHISSAIPIYFAAAVFPVVGIVKPSWLLHGATLLVTCVVAAAAFLLGRKLFPGKDITVRASAASGDAQIDQKINEGRERLDALRRINDALPDPEISRQLDRMTAAGESIFAALEKNPAHFAEVRRFMSYYLPTAQKLMESYTEVVNASVHGENAQNALKSVESSLTMIADAFEKQLDSLFRDLSFDVSAEISALETILQAEGLASK